MLINITRWLMLLISKLKVEESKKLIYSKVALIAMWTLIVIQLALTSLEPFTKDYEAIEIILMIWSKYIIVAIPLIGYPLIYYKLRKNYLELIAMQKDFL